MRNNKFIRLGIIFFCLAFLMTGVVSNGATQAELKAQQAATQKKKDEIKDKLDAAQDELDAQQAKLAAVISEEEKNKSELEILEQELDYILEQLDVLETTIKETEEDYNNKVATLKERARVMFQLSDYSTIQMLVESDSLKLDLESKKALQERTKGGYEELIAEKDKLLAGLKNQKETYSSLTAKAQSAVDALEDQEAEMDKASKELEARLKKLAEEEEAAKKQQQASGGGSSSGTGSHGGNPNFSGLGFIWPAPASHRISSSFGYRVHPISGSYKMHNGIDIAAPGGSNILASQEGTVIESGYHYSHGNYIVINHGNGYATAYYHASKLIAKAGQWVSRGQVIALVGTTGSSTGNHLHFEVRKNGVPQNPLNYVS